MSEIIVEYLSSFPTWFATIAMSALPVTELRLAIPVAIHLWLIHPMDAFALALIGNALPFFPLFYGLGWLRQVSEKRSPWLTTFLDSQIEHARQRVQQKYARYGAFALFLFTALPLPFTGLWTATLAAVALKVPLKHAVLGIFSGIVVAGIIVTVLSVGALQIL